MYEYLEVNAPSGEVAEKLNQLTHEGWEVVVTLPMLMEKDRLFWAVLMRRHVRVQDKATAPPARATMPAAKPEVPCTHDHVGSSAA
jgi:hypothetical protein